MKTTWATTEFRYADLGDQRLNQRLIRLTTARADRPEASLPQATQNGAATQAAYRFWDNERIQPDAILDAHRHATLQRLPPPEQGPLLAIQDTTTLDFAAHPATNGLGYRTAAGNRGLLAVAWSNCSWAMPRVCVGRWRRMRWWRGVCCG